MSDFDNSWVYGTLNFRGNHLGSVPSRSTSVLRRKTMKMLKKLTTFFNLSDRMTFLKWIISTLPDQLSSWDQCQNFGIEQNFLGPNWT